MSERKTLFFLDVFPYWCNLYFTGLPVVVHAYHVLDACTWCRTGVPGVVQEYLGFEGSTWCCTCVHIVVHVYLVLHRCIWFRTGVPGIVHVYLVGCQVHLVLFVQAYLVWICVQVYLMKGF